MKRAMTLAGLIAGAGALGGCLERRIHITSEPTGALVHLNDVEVGHTPVEVDFTYYGVYDVRVTKDGFKPLMTSAEASAPVYEWPVIDLAAEMIPARIVTDIEWHFTLEPADHDPDALIERARGLRGRFEEEVEGEFVGPPAPGGQDSRGSEP